jgi:rfaE bifunctional protein nucleotidyltransferase chain/domain
MSKLDIISAKIKTLESIRHDVARWKFFQKKIVFTNGCFDLLHRGHIEYLCKAADLGNVLVVGLNSDNSVRRLNKGTHRPLQDQDSRALIISALHVVEAVIIFDEDTPLELIRLVQPDVLVKGSDYDDSVATHSDPRYIVGSDIVKAAGGEVKTIDLVPGFSTTTIENKIKGD